MIRDIYRKMLHLTDPFIDGKNIFDREWELCILLDACRVDALEASISDLSVPDESEINVSSIQSVGTASEEWMKQTFSTDSAALSETKYITGNPHTAHVDKTDQFAAVDEVWRYGWDDELGTVPPRAITERAVAAGRENGADRILVHYMQPHTPYLARANNGLQRSGEVYNTQSRSVAAEDYFQKRTKEKDNPIDQLRCGEIEKETVWEAYIENLQIVLDEVSDLLTNITAETAVITADHGELFGEWGLYEHPFHMPVPELRSVPWVSTTAVDTGTLEPSLSPQQAEIDDDVDRRLRDLGYTE